MPKATNKNKRQSLSNRQTLGKDKDIGAKRAKLSILELPQQQRSQTTGVVLTFGQGEVGQLGLGEEIMEKSRPTLVKDVEDVVDVKAGGMHTLCLTKEGNVLAFGCDDDGALGRGATDEESFLPGKVDLPGPAVQIAAGDSHSAALLEDGRLFIWGSFRDSSGHMGLTVNGNNKKPVLVSLNATIIKVASGADHLVILTKEGHLYSCGCAEQGQLGRVSDRFSSRKSRQGMAHLLTPGLITFSPRKKYEFVDIWATTYCSFAKEKTKGIFAFGLNNYSQLGLHNENVLQIFHPTISESFDASKNFIKISGGEHHTVALDDEGKVYVVGRKEYGRLGLGKDSGDVTSLTLVPELNGEKCIDISASSSVSFAITEAGQCYAWGMGSNRQLGMGEDEDDLYTPRIIKGKQLENKKCVLVAAGGLHTALLVKPSISNGVV